MQISTYFIKHPEGWSPLASSIEPIGGKRVESVPSGGALLLAPFKTASIHSFSFPFRSANDVRNALALKFRPLLSGEDEVEIAPLFGGRTKGGSEGVALCIWEGEILDNEAGVSLHNNVVWPLPVALASAVKGDGGAVFRNDFVCASAFFRNGLPVYLRCRSSCSSDGGIDGEVQRLVDYVSALGSDIASESVWVSTKEQELLEVARETVKQYPKLLELNISKPALAASLARERTARMLLKACGWAAAAGILFSLIQYTMLSQLRSSVETFTKEGTSLYREIFGQNERVVDPLSQARAKLAELRGQGRTENSLSRTLSHLGRTWLDGNKKKAGYPVLEQLRYSADGADITGTAEKMEAIQALRVAADSGGYKASLGDIQQIPGGGLRFTLSLRRDAQ
ncbi:MAG: hypothetical protein CVV55_03195 [Synergistetes bacterium HGW-Synergistetes-2]|nr:MAG: hypothetical protein CVV55_03195 [Synergistetes bacterium HGW-Synergistetes-2]